MKFKYENRKWNYPFADGKHHHYHCCLSRNRSIIKKIKKLKSYKELEKYQKIKDPTQIENLRRNFSFIKTHSIYYSELSKLIEMNKTIKDSKS